MSHGTPARTSSPTVASRAYAERVAACGEALCLLLLSSRADAVSVPHVDCGLSLRWLVRFSGLADLSTCDSGLRCRLEPLAIHGNFWRNRDTCKTISAVAIVAAAALSTTGIRVAHASSGAAVLGGALGAAAGVMVGDDLGGRDGAVVGGALGGALGAALGTRGGHYSDDYYVVRSRPVYLVPAEPVYVVPRQRVYIHAKRPAWTHHKPWHKRKRNYRYDDD